MLYSPSPPRDWTRPRYVHGAVGPLRGKTDPQGPGRNHKKLPSRTTALENGSAGRFPPGQRHAKNAPHGQLTAMRAPWPGEPPAAEVFNALVRSEDYLISSRSGGSQEEPTDTWTVEALNTGRLGLWTLSVMHPTRGTRRTGRPPVARSPPGSER